MDPNDQNNDSNNDVEQQPQRILGGVASNEYGSDAAACQPYMCQPQHVRQQLQQVQMFWEEQYREIEQMTDFRNQSIPLARIKKIMRSDEDGYMIEAPVVFSRACEMFIFQVTFRAWTIAEENKRRTLQKNDVVEAISAAEVFDFLVDVIPKDDAGVEVFDNEELYSRM